MTTEMTDDVGFAALLEKVARERAFACGHYKERCMRRRIAVRMRARGVHSYEDYAALLDRDAAEYDRLVEALTINVTRFFRDRTPFEAIAATVIPELWAASDRPLGVWSAGCSSGEEPYSLAMLFHRHAVATGRTADLARLRITATDIDRPSLETARAARYADPAFVDMPADLLARYFTAAAPRHVVPEIRALVHFERRDLVAEPPPAAGLGLITCRNVLIYFDRETQESLFERFHDALAPGGFLALGKVETLLGPARSLFVPVDQRERVFRRR